MVPKMLILALIVGLASAATWIGKLPMKPKELMHKEGCYVSEINDVVPFGSVITPLGYCYSISCGQQMMNYASCGVVNVDDGPCHITELDTSKPYPSCCPTIKCDLDNNIN